jgi:hypothetical protein
MVIAVDFDGTIVKHKYPEIGEERPFATETLRMLLQQHHKLILWSIREGRLLEEAVTWCHIRGVDFFAVNEDYPGAGNGEDPHHSRKIKADVFIDDRNLGGVPDWGTIYRIITERKSLETIICEELNVQRHTKKKHWWSKG